MVSRFKSDSRFLRVGLVAILWVALVVGPSLLVTNAEFSRGAARTVGGVLGADTVPYLSGCPTRLIAYVLLTTTLGGSVVMLLGASWVWASRASTPAPWWIQGGMLLGTYVAILLAGLVIVSLSAGLSSNGHAVWPWAGRLGPLLVVRGFPLLSASLLVSSFAKRGWICFLGGAITLLAMSLLGAVDASSIRWWIAPPALDDLLFSGRPELYSRALLIDVGWSIAFSGAFAATALRRASARRRQPDAARGMKRS